LTAEGPEKIVPAACAAVTLTGLDETSGLAASSSAEAERAYNTNAAARIVFLMREVSRLSGGAI
jgi:hypothetical protein